MAMARATTPMLAGDRSGLGRITVAALVVILLVAMVISMTTGASGASTLGVIGG
ncbi:MAG: hypothetical protein MO852_17125 [Candidatus Devosia euplotis]|nr:hypothetical protein [Candidatus Devosia euplotis]